MRQLGAGPLIPQVSYGLLAGAFLGVASFAAVQTLRLQIEEQEEALGRARGEAEGIVRLWRTGVAQRATQWARQVAEAEDRPRAERQLRQTQPELLGVALWSLTAAEPMAVYPKPAEAAAPSPCLEEAAAQTGQLPLSAAARRWRACTGGGARQDLAAAVQVARLLLADGQASAAFEAVTSTTLPLYAPLAAARPEGAEVDLQLERRLLAAEALGVTGDRPRQAQLLERTSAELQEVPPWALARALPALEQLIPQAAAVSDPDQATTLLGRLGTTRARLVGWEEAAQWVRSGRGGAAGPSAEVLPIDGGGSEVAVLGLRLQAEPPLVATVTLSGEPLVAELRSLASAALPGRDTEVLARHRANPCESAEPVVASLAPTLPDGRLVLCQPLGEGTSRGPLTGLATRLAPMIAALALGAFALAGRVAADRRQRELYERQRAFISRVTHELKTPLAGIRVMAETLELGAVPPERLPAWAARIMDETDRLTARVDEVLKLARREERTRIEPIALHLLAAEVSAPWVPRIEAVGGQLSSRLDPCPDLPGDRALLADALGNLLDNALKYRREDRPLQVQLSTRVDGRWVVVEVSDNGLGVPPAMRKAIFEPFARIEGPGRGKAGGHGLGLSFVAETARVHGGQIECRESPEGGARFLLRLRRKRWTPVGWPASWWSKTTTPSGSGS